MSRSAQVAIVQQYLTHYRVPFFERLYADCAQNGISLTVYFGSDKGRHIHTNVPEWCIPSKVSSFSGLTWQSVWTKTASADLVVVEQAVKHIINYGLLARRLATSQRIALWGHGKNFQSRNLNSFQECIKRFVSRHVDWWFAYNDLSMRIVQDLGYPSHRITSVQNAIDTRSLRACRFALSNETLGELRKDLGIFSDNVAIYTGGLYADKRIPFLLQACLLIRALIPDFHLIVVGQGPDEAHVQHAAQRNPWIHYVGAKNDADKVPYWALSKVFLMPGLVGLAVLDSFALSVPIVTTSYPYHSPEIDYLKDGVNGLVVEDWENPSAYAGSVAHLLRDEPLRQRLITAGNADAEHYTIETMVSRFTSGIQQALREDKL